VKRVVAQRLGIVVSCLIFMLALGACGSNNSGSSATSSATSSASSETAAPSSSAEPESSAAADIAAPTGLMTPGTLTLGVDATYPPLESYDENQKLIGFDIEFGEAVGKALGLQVKWVDTRFEGLIPGLNSNKFDAIISGITITEERAKTLDFIPFFSSGQSMIGRKDANLTIKDDHDVAGLNLAVVSGSIQDIMLKDTIIPDLKASGKDVKVSTYPSNPEAVQQLIKKTADAVFLDSPVALDLISKFKELAIVSPDFNPKNRGIVTRKGDTEMAGPLEAVYQKLVQDGTVDTLLKKYGLNQVIPN
jgi:polar amino acid transport system substrate-binding protein